MDRAKLHAAIDVVLDVLEERESDGASDAVVPLTREALMALGFDYAPALQAAQSGALKTVWQGRRRLTTRAWLLGYVQALPVAVALDATDDLAVAATKRAARRVA